MWQHVFPKLNMFLLKYSGKEVFKLFDRHARMQFRYSLAKYTRMYRIPDLATSTAGQGTCYTPVSLRVLNFSPVPSSAYIQFQRSVCVSNYWYVATYWDSRMIYIPVWLRMCFLRAHCSGNSLLHELIGHWKGLSPLCRRMWHFHASLCRNDLLQYSHFHGRSPVCLFMCSLNCTNKPTTW